MSTSIRLGAGVVLLAAGLAGLCGADHRETVSHHGPAAGGNSCQEAVRYVCKPVPEVQKKTHVVYGCRQEVFCTKECTLHGKECSGSCPGKVKPRVKNLLIKKTVTEEKPAVKWVAEKVVEVVPCPVNPPARPPGP